MLKHLRIQNFAIIDAIEITFGKGLNIISGETGAGKSIIMDALFLILGGRASGDLIRKGAEEAVVEALFDFGQTSELKTILENAGLSCEDDELIVRRIVSTSGKNRIFINGSMVNTSTLSSVTTHLVDLCGQHDQQMLTKPDEQLLWLDRFAKLEDSSENIKTLFLDWKNKREALTALSTNSAHQAQRIDFLRFQIQELKDADLQSPSEDSELENELKILASSEALFSFASEAEAAVLGSDTDVHSMVSSVGSLLNRVKSLSSIDPALSTAQEFLNTLKINLEELGIFLRNYTSRISRNEARLEDIHSRLALLTKLKRKYGPSLDQVMKSLELFESELSLLENHDSTVEEAIEAERGARSALEKACAILSKARTKAAKEFSAAVEKELSDLNMDRARFECFLQSLEEPNITGKDQARFQIASNPGEPMNGLHKIASGGELSRIMLAIHNVVSSRGGVGVYLFDEVDSGIGGQTAVTVGAKIQKVARNNQVICITHLPQVACFADMHFHVEKKILKKAGNERTVCSVIPLVAEDREREIARMLGGLGNEKAALANAKAMLAKSKKHRPLSGSEKTI